MSRFRSAAASAILGGALSAVAFGAQAGTDLASSTTVSILVALGGGGAAGAARPARPGRTGARRSGGRCCWPLFTAVTALSAAWSIAPGRHRRGGRPHLRLPGRRSPPRVAAARAVSDSAAAWWRAAIALAGVMVCGWALATRIWPGSLGGDLLLTSRLGAPFDYWNALGGLAALALPPVLWLAARRDPPASRALAYPAMGVLMLTHPADPVARRAGRGGRWRVAVWFVVVPLRLRSAAGRGAARAGRGARRGVGAVARPVHRAVPVGRARRRRWRATSGCCVLAMCAVLLLAGLVVQRIASRAPRRRSGCARRAGVVADGGRRAPAAGGARLGGRERPRPGRHRVRSLRGAHRARPRRRRRMPAGWSSASSSRGEYWRQAGKIFEERPLLGTGREHLRPRAPALPQGRPRRRARARLRGPDAGRPRPAGRCWPLWRCWPPGWSPRRARSGCVPGRRATARVERRAHGARPRWRCAPWPSACTRRSTGPGPIPGTAVAGAGGGRVRGRPGPAARPPPRHRAAPAPAAPPSHGRARRRLAGRGRCARDRRCCAAGRSGSRRPRRGRTTARWTRSSGATSEAAERQADEARDARPLLARRRCSPRAQALAGQGRRRGGLPRARAGGARASARSRHLAAAGGVRAAGTSTCPSERSRPWRPRRQLDPKSRRVEALLQRDAGSVCAGTGARSLARRRRWPARSRRGAPSAAGRGRWCPRPRAEAARRPRPPRPRSRARLAPAHARGSRPPARGRPAATPAGAPGRARRRCPRSTRPRRPRSRRSAGSRSPARSCPRPAPRGSPGGCRRPPWARRTGRRCAAAPSSPGRTHSRGTPRAGPRPGARG